MERKIYYSLATVVILLVGISVWLLVNSHNSASHMNIIPTNSSMQSITVSNNSIPADSLPVIHDLPLDFNRIQAEKLRLFIYQIGINSNSSDGIVGYYRAYSSDASSFFIDIQSLQQTILVKLRTNNTLGISCADKSDQLEATWNCDDSKFGESE